MFSELCLKKLSENILIILHGISVCTVLCEETEALDSLQNNTQFSIFSEICCFFLVKHTQNILVAEQNTCSVGKFHTPNFEALLLTSTNYVSKPFNSPNFKFWKGENAAPIIFSGVEVNKHVSGCEQTLTWHSRSSQASVCSENNVREHCETSHLTFRTTAPMHAILAHFCVKIASV